VTSKSLKKQKTFLPLTFPNMKQTQPKRTNIISVISRA